MDKDKAEILSMLTNAISTFQIPAICVGRDEKVKESWMRKQYWLDVHQMLTNYFSGQELFNGIDFFGDRKKINKEKEELSNDFQWRIALYNMLHYGWDEIKRGLSGVQLPAETPGKAFVWCLEEEIRGMQERLNKNIVVNQRALYAAYLQRKKCRKLEDPNGYVPSEEVRKLEVLVNRVKKKDNLPVSEGTVFVLTCVDICLTSKDTRVRQKARDYQSYSDEVFTVATRRGRYA